jgi:DNA-binding MarR family transcriptional regulator
MSVELIDCAREVLDVVPLAMRTIRAEMRSRRGLDLSVPQFRALLFIKRRPGAALNQVAEFLGLTAPSTSRMIDGLVQRGLVKRGSDDDDRRKLALRLTSAGQGVLDTARQGTLRRLSGMLERLDADQRLRLVSGLEDLRSAISATQTTTAESRDHV